jgi:hypothetical protein
MPEKQIPGIEVDLAAREWQLRQGNPANGGWGARRWVESPALMEAFRAGAEWAQKRAIEDYEKHLALLTPAQRWINYRA